MNPLKKRKWDFQNIFFFVIEIAVTIKYLMVNKNIKYKMINQLALWSDQMDFIDLSQTGKSNVPSAQCTDTDHFYVILNSIKKCFNLPDRWSFFQI